MKRLFWGTLLLTLTLGLYAQSTWRGQADLWTGAGAPTAGYVAASNDFTKNSLVTIENYKTKKIVQVRIVAGLPAGASAFILVSPKAAAALGMNLGDTPLVGVKVDTTIAGTKGLAEDSAVNPDPDVNLTAAQPKVVAKAITPKVTETPKVETPKVVETPPVVETPKVETPKVVETPKIVETPKVETPAVVEAPKVETLLPETPATETPEVAETSEVTETPIETVPEPAKVAETPKTPQVESEPVAAPLKPEVVPAPVAEAPTASPSARPLLVNNDLPTVLRPATPTPASVARTTESDTHPSELTNSNTTLDPELMPLLALEAPAVVTPEVATEIENDTAPVTPGRRVFLSSTDTDTVADQPEVVEETPPVEETPEVVETPPVEETPEVVETPPVEETPEVVETPPVEETPEVVETPPVEETPEVVETPPVEETPEVVETPPVEETPEVVETPPVEETPEVVETPPVEETPEVVETPPVEEIPEVVETPPVEEIPEVVETPPVEETPEVVEAPPVITPTPTTTPAVVLAPPAPAAAATAWVSTPGKLTGPVLGNIGVVAQLVKGKAYVQVAAFPTQAALLTALDSMKSYVPVSLYKAEGEKNPWRILIDSAPKAQMGILMMEFRSQGFRNAAIVKG